MKKNILFTLFCLQLCLTRLWAHPGHSHEILNLGVGVAFFVSLFALLIKFRKSKKKI